MGLRVPEAPCVRKHANLSMREMLVFVILSSRIVRVNSLKVECRLFAHVTSTHIVLLPLIKSILHKKEFNSCMNGLLLQHGRRDVKNTHTIQT